MTVPQLDHDIEWEFQASVLGTVYARSEEEAMQKAEMMLYSVRASVDVEWVEPVDPSEMEEAE